MIGDEGPEKPVPDRAPVALFFIGHFENIVRSRDVRFGGERPAVGKLGHAIDIWHHDPVIGIDEHFHKPAVDVVGTDPAEQHEIAQNHETFDVVAVAVL